MQDKSFLCYAHGHGNEWEALCVDLDIAVQGRSFDEVKALLNASVTSYIEDACREDPKVRDRLLSRSAPLHVKAKVALKMLGYTVFEKLRQKEVQASFGLQCHA